jgi:hypothetical protein
MRGSKRSSSIALGKTENLLSSRERVAIEIPNEETRHLLEYQVTIETHHLPVPECQVASYPEANTETRHLPEYQVSNDP